MEINKTIYKSIFVWLSMYGMISCERKDLHYPSQSNLRLITHWEEQINNKPLYNEVIFYPINGGREYRYYVGADTVMLSLPIQEYHVVLYNWRTNAAAQTVQFRNHHKYAEMTSFTGSLTNKSGYFDRYDLFLAPDMLYSWTTEEYEPFQATTHASNKESVVTLHTYPRRVVHEYNFHVEVIGLEHVHAVSAVALGFASELTMYNKQGNQKDAGHKLNIKLTKTGFQCRFSAYNHHAPNNQRLLFVIKLPDGSFCEYHRDINAELDEKGTIEHVKRIIITYIGPVTPPPSVGGGFEPPEIGDWESMEEDIIFPSQALSKN